MATARRIEKINILLREVIAAILERDVSFPPGVLATVTRVETTDDLYYAAAYVSVLGPVPQRSCGTGLGPENAEREVLEQLRHETAAVQRALNRKLRMRPVPRISFAIDQNEKRRERIEKLLSDQK